MADDERVVICPLVNRAEDPLVQAFGLPVADWIPVPGMTQDACEGCESPIMVSPSSRLIQYEELNVHLLCWECGQKRIAAAEARGEENRFAIHPAQIHEVLENLEEDE